MVQRGIIIRRRDPETGQLRPVATVVGGVQRRIEEPAPKPGATRTTITPSGTAIVETFGTGGEVVAKTAFKTAEAAASAAKQEFLVTSAAQRETEALQLQKMKAEKIAIEDLSVRERQAQQRLEGGLTELERVEVQPERFIAPEETIIERRFARLAGLRPAVPRPEDIKPSEIPTDIPFIRGSEFVERELKEFLSKRGFVPEKGLRAEVKTIITKDKEGKIIGVKTVLVKGKEVGVFERAAEIALFEAPERIPGKLEVPAAFALLTAAELTKILKRPSKFITEIPAGIVGIPKFLKRAALTPLGLEPEPVTMKELAGVAAAGIVLRPVPLPKIKVRRVKVKKERIGEVIRVDKGLVELRKEQIELSKALEEGRIQTQKTIDRAIKRGQIKPVEELLESIRKDVDKAKFEKLRSEIVQKRIERAIKEKPKTPEKVLEDINKRFEAEQKKRAKEAEKPFKADEAFERQLELNRRKAAKQLKKEQAKIRRDLRLQEQAAQQQILEGAVLDIGEVFGKEAIRRAERLNRLQREALRRNIARIQKKVRPPAPEKVLGTLETLSKTFERNLKIQLEKRTKLEQRAKELAEKQRVRRIQRNFNERGKDLITKFQKGIDKVKVEKILRKRRPKARLPKVPRDLKPFEAPKLLKKPKRGRLLKLPEPTKEVKPVDVGKQGQKQLLKVKEELKKEGKEREGLDKKFKNLEKDLERKQEQLLKTKPVFKIRRIEKKITITPERLLFLDLQRQKELTKSQIKQAQKQIEEQQEKTAEEQIQITEQIQKQVPVQIEVPKIVPVTIEVPKLKAPPIIAPPITPEITIPKIPVPPVLKPPGLKPPITPLVPRIEKKKPKVKKKREGFNVFVKSRGKFKLANRSPLPRRKAINKGANVVDSHPAATFVLRKAKRGTTLKDDRVFKKRKKFRRPKGKSRLPKDSYIEKNKFRLDMPGELAGITFKGLETLKRLPALRKRKKTRRKKR